MTTIAVKAYGRPEPFSVPVGAYPSGEPMVKAPDLMAFIAEHSPGAVESVMVRTANVADLMATLFFVDALADQDVGVERLALPYVPGARQDRANGPGGDMLVTAKSIAGAINARKFSSVIVLDPHSDVASALIDRCRIIHAADCINPPAGKYAGVVSPDGGAEKRAGRVAAKLGLPLLHAWKKRDTSTGKIAGFGVEPIGLPAGARLLIVDDICDGGGTFIGLRPLLSDFDVDLYVTHGLFTQGTEILLKTFHHVYCTDSLPGERPGVIEVKVCDRLVRERAL